MAKWLLVGADRGIGRAMAEHLAARGDDVHAACLGNGDGLKGPRITVVPNVDVTSDASVAAMAAALAREGASFDCVVQVAGVLGLDQLGKIDFDDVRRQFEINTIGPLRTIEAILDRLAPAAKVGIITSRVGSLTDNGSGGLYAYRLSKCAANMVALNLHHDLKSRGIAVLALHPGMVATDLTKDVPGNFTYIQPGEAAAGLVARMDELTLETSGEFRHANGERLPW